VTTDDTRPLSAEEEAAWRASDDSDEWWSHANVRRLLATLDAERARHAALVAAAQVGLDIFGDGDGHSTEYVDHEWRCTDDCRADAWLARVRAALASEEVG
jgi:hypothetical protein